LYRTESKLRLDYKDQAADTIQESSGEHSLTYAISSYAHNFLKIKKFNIYGTRDEFFPEGIKLQ
jgi:hypothetical protein